MNKSDDKPVLLSKRKNIQTLIDYCLETRLGFTVNPRAISNDEFEIEVEITNFKQAIALGMFAKENKFEVTGMGDLVKPKVTTTTTNSKKTETKEVVAPLLGNLTNQTETTDKTEKEDTTLNFNLGSTNN